MFRKCLKHLPALERRRIVMPDGVRMRLNRLEMQIPWTREQLEAMRESLPLETISQYPDYGPFYERLALESRHPVERIVVGAGIEEFIRMLMAMTDKRIVLQDPTCAMHRVYGDAYRSRLTLLPTDPRRRMTAEQISDAITGEVGMLLWANPGQPVQDYLTELDLHRVALACERNGAVLAIDEAYHGFGAMSALRLVHAHPNVIVLRTFSKAMGLAGCRIGYAVAQRPLIGFLDAVRQSGEVSSLSIHLATWAMDNPEIIRRRAARVVEGRELLRHRLTALGVRSHGDFGNSLLVDCVTSQTKLDILNALAARGILVRDALETHLMVTCGDPKLMSDFADEFARAAAPWMNTFSKREMTAH